MGLPALANSLKKCPNHGTSDISHATPMFNTSCPRAACASMMQLSPQPSASRFEESSPLPRIMSALDGTQPDPLEDPPGQELDKLSQRGGQTCLECRDIR